MLHPPSCPAIGSLNISLNCTSAHNHNPAVMSEVELLSRHRRILASHSTSTSTPFIVDQVAYKGEVHKAFLKAYGPSKYLSPSYQTPNERFGFGVGVVTAADRVYHAPSVDKKAGKYARPRRVFVDDYTTVSYHEKAQRFAGIRESRYRYYDYSLPTMLYTEKGHMYE